ncbi:conserved hypothetical protein [Burkholderia pseudomallei 576]|nr:conserved hypothetical protein [Burkholderia pseudomallei 576]
MRRSPLAGGAAAWRSFGAMLAQARDGASCVAIATRAQRARRMASSVAARLHSVRFAPTRRARAAGRR